MDGFILKEKEFRAALNEFDWSIYKDAYICLNCSTDAILPAWTYILITSHLNSFSKSTIQGSKKDLLISIYIEKLRDIDFSIYKDLPVILKGCSNKPVPQEVYVLAHQKIITYARSIMFGEACSAVPLYKKV